MGWLLLYKLLLQMSLILQYCLELMPQARCRMVYLQNIIITGSVSQSNWLVTEDNPNFHIMSNVFTHVKHLAPLL